MITFRSLGNHGRLGNQLFQIAATIGLADKLGTTAVFPQWPYSNDIAVLCKSEESLNALKWTPRWEHTFKFDETIFSAAAPDENIALQGYFQSEKYFEHCKGQVHRVVMNETTLKRRDELKQQYSIDNDNEKICAVHVRRGDYLSLPDHYVNVSESGYYSRAWQAMMDTGVRLYIIFSDDILWCKQTIRGPGVRYSRETKVFDDLLLMSLCSRHIIANSSFSWWGSWLADSRLTIAPAKWFGPAIPHDTSDLYRPEMVLL